MTDALLGMILLALVFGLFPSPRDRRLVFTWRDVLDALLTWLALGAIVLGAALAVDASIYGPPSWLFCWP
jgi:hypothetical protein